MIALSVSSIISRSPPMRLFFERLAHDTGDIVAQQLDRRDVDREIAVDDHAAVLPVPFGEHARQPCRLPIGRAGRSGPDLRRSE